MAKRFEGKKTVVRGFIINLANGTSEPFELETDYTRTLEKAAKQLNANAPEGFQYVATELVNEKAEPIVYDASLLMNYAKFDSIEEESANEFAESLLHGTVRKAANWLYHGDVWMRSIEPIATYEDGNGIARETYQYLTECVTDTSVLNLTKTEIRSFIAMSAESLNNGFKCIGVSNEYKERYSGSL